MAEFPAMPLWTDAYLSDTTHLTCIEHGAYFLLLMTAWRAKSHCLPDNDKLLSQFCKLTLPRWRKIRPRLEPFFEIQSGFWFNARLLDELEAVRRRIEQRSVAGTRSAIRRQYRNSRNDSGKHVMKRKDSDTTAKPLIPLDVTSTAVQRTFNGRSTSTTTKTEEASEQANGIGSKELLATLQRRGWVQ